MYSKILRVALVFSAKVFWDSFRYYAHEEIRCPVLDGRPKMLLIGNKPQPNREVGAGWERCLVTIKTVIAERG